MSELIRCTSVCKDYERGPQSVRVLDSVDFSVEDGAFVALMGPSGSGKTTLLNLIGGLDAPTAGEIEVDGLRLDSAGAKSLALWRARSVGFVFQFYNLLPVLSAQQCRTAATAHQAVWFRASQERRTGIEHRRFGRSRRTQARSTLRWPATEGRHRAGVGFRSVLVGLR